MGKREDRMAERYQQRVDNKREKPARVKLAPDVRGKIERIVVASDIRDKMERIDIMAMDLPKWATDFLYQFESDRARYQKPTDKEPEFIMPGDVVEATRNGTRDANGLPELVPLEGEQYRIDSFYVAPYGIGCVLSHLDGTPMDNYPYRGFVFERSPARGATARYFKKVED